MGTRLLWRYCACAEVYFAWDQYFSDSTQWKLHVVWLNEVVGFPKKFWCQRVLKQRTLLPGHFACYTCSSTIELLPPVLGGLPKTYHLYRSQVLFVLANVQPRVHLNTPCWIFLNKIFLKIFIRWYERFVCILTSYEVSPDLVRSKAKLRLDTRSN